MRSVVICEKPSQARNIVKAVGNRYGEVLPAQGHLLRLMLPEEENPAWKNWSTELLRPERGRYRLVPDAGGGKSERFRSIKSALASADQVIIATDCDREGQAIGENLLHFCGFKGTVKRAMFTAEDEKTLAAAFETARPNESYRTLYEAAIARQQADQIFNLSLTRAATVTLVPKGVRAVIGVGRVKTATMAIVCRRERELATFQPRDYFELVAEVAIASGHFPLFHKPAAEARLFDRGVAERLAAAVTDWCGPIGVTRERKHQSPSRPVDLPTLQKRASAWGWTAKKTLETAQSLYETHKVTTYPRAATRYLPENMVSEAMAAYEGLARAGLAGGWDQPVIRKGKSGVFCDAGLSGEAHHAIIPNPAVAADFADRLEVLAPDERRLFDFIARQFVVSLGPDHIYDRTEITIAPVLDGRPVRFNAIGKVTVEPGWKATLARGESDEEGEEEDGEKEQTLPTVADGDSVRVDRTQIEAKVTTPPLRYTEGSLIDAMQNAWKFVGNVTERERLKEAKGIGTPATRDTIIEGLKHQGLVLVTKGKLVASDTAMQLYELLAGRCPTLLDPGATARMEALLDAVVAGEADATAVIDELCEQARRLIAALASGESATLAIRRKPSPKMLEAARLKAKREGSRLQREISEDYDTCRAYLGPLPARTARNSGAAAAPSAAQLALAERIAERNRSELPADVRADARELSIWIDEHNVASENQLRVIAKLVNEGKIKQPMGYPDKVAAGEASKILDKAFASRGVKRR